MSSLTFVFWWDLVTRCSKPSCHFPWYGVAGDIERAPSPSLQPIHRYLHRLYRTSLNVHGALLLVLNWMQKVVTTVPRRPFIIYRMSISVETWTWWQSSPPCHFCQTAFAYAHVWSLYQVQQSLICHLATKWYCLNTESCRLYCLHKFIIDLFMICIVIISLRCLIDNKKKLLSSVHLM